jgi:hypothetical protein
MDSGFDDWVYWHFFTITVDYDSSDIELLLNDVCLTNLSEESLHGNVFAYSFPRNGPYVTVCNVPNYQISQWHNPEYHDMNKVLMTIHFKRNKLPYNFGMIFIISLYVAQRREG